MTTEQVTALVLKDGAGSYFLVPQETLEQGRVRQERNAELERLIAEQGDVQGHAGMLVIIGLGVLAVSAELAIGIGFSGPEVQGTLKGIKPREQLVGGGGQTPR